MLDLKNFFARSYVVNLDDDADRLARFRALTAPDRWPFVEPLRWRAAWGRKCPHPEWWHGGGGAWGCFRSHVQIIEQCLMDEVPSVLILEDDAVPVEGFAGKVRTFLENVPKDWGMIYLGGQHLQTGSHPPQRVNSEVYRPYNVNRTHAFAMSLEGMKAVYKHLCRQDWKPSQHIDHHLGRLHMSGTLPVYCPREWLIGQAAGKSRISGRTPPLRFWTPAGELSPGPSPFVAIVGLHSSGSSAIAAVCWNLGLHLGNKLTGYYKVDEKHCGFEAAGLAQLCEKAARFPSTTIADPRRVERELANWIADRQREAVNKKTIAGGKYPHLCRLGEPLQSICGDGLYVVHCDRPLDESIASLQRRVQQGTPKCSAEDAEAVQRWLWEGKQQLLQDVPDERQITIAYDDLLHNPPGEIARLVEFLKLTPGEQQLATAAAVVNPDKRHIHLTAQSL